MDTNILLERIAEFFKPLQNAINGLQDTVARVEKTQAAQGSSLARLQTEQSYTNSGIDALKAGIDDLREQIKTKANKHGLEKIEAKMATKEDIEATVDAAKTELKSDIYVL